MDRQLYSRVDGNEVEEVRRQQLEDWMGLGQLSVSGHHHPFH